MGWFGYMRVVSALLLCTLSVATAEAASVTWIGGNNTWIDNGSTANWNPPDEPDPDDEAIFNTSNVVNMGSHNSISALTMSGGIDLLTNDFNLTVGGLVQLTGASTNLLIGGAASALSAVNLTINNGGMVELTGGALSVLNVDAFLNGTVAINAGGTLAGNGTVQLDAPLLNTVLINNNGTLAALSRPTNVLFPPPVGTLVINAGSAPARVDLDGSGENGTVNVNRNQTLDVNVPLNDTFNGTLNLFQNTTLDISTNWTLGAGGLVNVDNGAVGGFPGVPAGTATIAGGTLTQSGGTMVVVDTDGTLIFAAPFTMNAGTLTNHGLTVFNGNTTIAAGANFSLASAGADFIVGPGVTVTINQTNFDFDGPNAGITTVTVNPLGRLNVNSSDYDLDPGANGFDGVIHLNNGDISVQTADARFVMNGILNMHSDMPGQITQWEGQPVDIGNDLIASAQLNVTGNQISRFGSVVRFRSDAAVNVAAGAILDFNNVVHFEPVGIASTGQFAGSGTIRFNGAVNVNEATTLDMTGGTIDLDGVDSVGDLISVNAALTLKAAALTSFGRTNAGGGVNVIHVDALSAGSTGSLTVNLDDPNGAWTINPQGTLALSNTNALATLLAGSDVTLNGSLNVAGMAGTAARIDLAGVANLTTAFPNGGLFLQGGSLAQPNRIENGLVNGPGALRASSGRAMSGYGTINARIEFEGTSELIAEGGQLNVTGIVADVGTMRVMGPGAVLNLTSSMSTSVSNNGIVLSGGTLQGGTITVATIAQGIRGFGMVTNPIVNNGAIEAQGGTLELTNAANDWDGGTNAGQLRASGGGSLDIFDNAGTTFGGSVIAVEDSRVFASGFDLHFSSGSTIQLSGSKFQSTNTAQINGSVMVLAGNPSTIEIAVNRFLDFGATSTVTLNGDLRLVSNNADVAAGTTFFGNGSLVIPEGSNLIARASSNINVLVDVHGRFFPGGLFAAGRTDLRDYQQRPTGRLEVDIRGTSLTQFDRVVVNGDAVLAGGLRIAFGGGFVPAAGDAFTVVSGISVSGTFDTVETFGLPSGLSLQVQYAANFVRLLVLENIPGDLDGDFDVDATDWSLFLACMNGPGVNIPPFSCQVGHFSRSDIDGDGDVDLADSRHFQRCYVGSGVTGDPACAN